MKVLLGVGSELNGDDGIGPWVAQHFHAAGWQPIDCFTVPENYTSRVKRLQPTAIVIVDAADMAIHPGEMRIIPLEAMGAASFSTHMLPLSMIVTYLAEATSADIWIIGIQPEQFDGGLSPAVLSAGKELLHLLASGEWSAIDLFSPR
jgi:hydrogenase 3 maturation protease